MLTQRVTAWAAPSVTPALNATLLKRQVLMFANDTKCFVSSSLDTTSLPMYADLTWVFAAEQKNIVVFLEENPQFTVNFTQKGYFQSLADLAAEPVANLLNAWYVADSDNSASQYTGFLTDSQWASPLWQDDNGANVLLPLPTGLLYPRANMLLFYRRDVFEEQGFDPPHTWDELLATAAALTGSNFSGSGDTGGYGICLDLKPNCKSNYYLMAIAASLIQTHGLTQGLYMDPTTLAPLVDNPAIVEALRIFTALAALANQAPGSNTTCSAWNSDWDQGRCAMTIEWDVFLRWVNQDNSKLFGQQLAGPRLAGLRLAGPRLAGPRLAGPRLAGPRLAGPRLAGPRLGGPRLAGRRRDRGWNVRGRGRA